MLTGPDILIGEDGAPYGYGSESALGLNISSDLGEAVKHMLVTEMGDLKTETEFPESDFETSDS